MTTPTILNRLTGFALDDAGLKPATGLEDAIALHVELHTRPAAAHGYVVQGLDGAPLKDSEGNAVTDLVGLVRHLAETKPGLFQGVVTNGIAETAQAPVRDVLDPLPTVNPWARGTSNLTERMRIARDNPDLAARLKAEAQATDAGPNLTALMLAANRNEPGALDALRAFTTRKNS